MTQDLKEKKDTRNKIIIGIILVGLMILSTAGYAFYNTDSESVKKIKYYDTEFVLGEDGLWHSTIQGYGFSTQYNPTEVENISINLNLNLDSYTNKPVYFSFESNPKGIDEIIRNLGTFVERSQLSCLDGEKCEGDLPVKNCTDNVIIIKEGTNKITQEDNCVYIFGNYSEITKASDAFIFRILGIV